MDQRRRFSARVAKGRDPHSTILEALQFARDFLPHSSLDESGQNRAAIVIEELVSNILRHGGGRADHSLWLSIEDANGALAVEIEDDGIAFDPSAANPFDGPNPKTGGGIGLAIVRAWGTDITFARNGDRNLLKLTIK